MRIIMLLMVACLLAGCHRSMLKCRTEYLYPTYLASEQVNTPDPRRLCFYGQQVIVSWNLPREFAGQPIDLILKVRYGDRMRETFSIPIERPCGHWVYRLVNDEYWCRNGILSFQALLCQEGEVLDQWSHHLWTEIIDISL